jgi:hypothetical protein
VCAVLAAGCKKKEELPLEPAIELKSVSATSVVQFDNEITITIAYTDHNGDLGYEDPDVYAIRVKDSRLEAYDWYHLPPVTPDMMELDVSGTFAIVLNPLFLLGNGQQEVTSFKIQLRDRAGNWSNEISTGNITIVESL